MLEKPKPVGKIGKSRNGVQTPFECHSYREQHSFAIRKKIHSMRVQELKITLGALKWKV